MPPSHDPGAAFVWDDDPFSDELLRAATADLVSAALPDWAIALVEKGLGAQRGDLLAGNVLAMHVRDLGRYVDLNVRVPGQDTLVPIRVDVFTDEDVRTVAKAFAILLEWERRDPEMDKGDPANDNGTEDEP